ncbi:MAG: RNA recognition motif domain-containing protein [Bacteroidales bacterium]
MNIYIGNLNFTVDEDKLRRIFEKYGEVSSVKLIRDKDTGESKGYGFIEMKNDEEAKKALQEMNSQEIDGRHVKVNIAKPRKRNYRR